jgi:hypothetical protein
MRERFSFPNTQEQRGIAVIGKSVFGEHRGAAEIGEQGVLKSEGEFHAWRQAGMWDQPAVRNSFVTAG